MRSIPIANINLGGLADSIYQGPKNSVASMLGLDLHSVPGVIKINQKLTKISSTTIDDEVSKTLPCSDGSSYAFGRTNGKIWKITSGFTVTLSATAAPAAGAVGILDAFEYQGYIYYMMQNRIGRVAVGAPTDWSTRNDSWATFLNGNATHHPCEEVNAVLYIGDGHDLAQVDAGTFSNSALDLEAPYVISALAGEGTELLIGTTVDNNVQKTKVFRWNTYSVSFNYDDGVPEVGINAFIKGDNFTLASVGVAGNLYKIVGTKLELYKKIPGTYSPTAKGKVWLNASCFLQSRLLFGFSNMLGNPALEAVYGFGGYDGTYKKVLTREYAVSTGDVTYIEITSMACLGNTDMLVTWKKTTPGAPDTYTYGMDKLDYSAKHTGAYLETRIIKVNRELFQKFMEYYANWVAMPTGCAIVMKYKKNNAAAWSSAVSEFVKDVDRNQYAAQLELQATTLQLRFEFTVSVNDAPEVDEFNVWVQ